MELKFGGKLEHLAQKAWAIEYPDGRLSFENWCLAAIANAAARNLQQAVAAETREALNGETKKDLPDEA